MPSFRYKALTPEGETISGVYESPTTEGVAQFLRHNGYLQLSISLVANKSLFQFSMPVSLKVLGRFCNQAASMLRAGVPISSALIMLTEQETSRSLRKILVDVSSKVQQGSSLGEAFQPHQSILPPFFLSMIEAGEASGRLEFCLARAGRTFSTTAKLNSKVRGAMVYPVFLILLTITVLAVLLTVVVPSFVSLFAQYGAQLPLLTRMLLAVSTFIQTRWYIVLLALVSIISGTIVYLKTPIGRYTLDSIKLKLPVIAKINRTIYSARYAHTFGALSTAGVPIAQALQVTSKSILNVVVSTKLMDTVEAVNNGSSLSEQLASTKCFPPMIIHLTQIGETAGTMNQLLEQAATYYDEESENVLHAFTTLMEPMLIVVMALVITPILLAIVQPLFQMYTLIGA